MSNSLVGVCGCDCVWVCVTVCVGVPGLCVSVWVFLVRRGCVCGGVCLCL